MISTQINSLYPLESPPIASLDPFFAHRQAQIRKWQKLGQHTVRECLEKWLSQLSEITSLTYRQHFKGLVKDGLINLNSTLQEFSLIEHNAIIDEIKCLPNLSEAYKQTRASAYIALTKWLSRLAPEFIRKAEPCREGTNRTFFQIRDKTVYLALKKHEWEEFFYHLKKVSVKGYLIASCMLQGAKRINEVLAARVENISWGKNQITFEQSKVRYAKTHVIITYPQHYMDELKAFLKERTEGYIFQTRFGKPIDYRQVKRWFDDASKLMGLKKPITTHVMRATAVTYLKQLGYQDSEIAKVTGHSKFDVSYYDKTSAEHNITREIYLI